MKVAFTSPEMVASSFSLASFTMVYWSFRIDSACIIFDFLCLLYKPKYIFFYPACNTICWLSPKQNHYKSLTKNNLKLQNFFIENQSSNQEKSNRCIFRRLRTLLSQTQGSFAQAAFHYNALFQVIGWKQKVKFKGSGRLY